MADADELKPRHPALGEWQRSCLRLSMKRCERVSWLLTRRPEGRYL
jgi:hypothetical protein